MSFLEQTSTPLGEGNLPAIRILNPLYLNFSTTHLQAQKRKKKKKEKEFQSLFFPKMDIETPFLGLQSIKGRHKDLLYLDVIYRRRLVQTTKKLNCVCVCMSTVLRAPLSLSLSLSLSFRVFA